MADYVATLNIAARAAVNQPIIAPVFTLCKSCKREENADRNAAFNIGYLPRFCGLHSRSLRNGDLVSCVVVWSCLVLEFRL